MPHVKRPTKGPSIRKTSPIASCVAAATDVVLYNPPGATVPSGAPLGAAQVVGTRTFMIRKLIVNNRQAAPVTVQIGYNITPGAAGGYTQAMPGFYAINGQDNEWTEDQLPNFEFWTSALVRASAAAVSPSDVQVQIEVEEFLAGSAPSTSA